MMIYVIVINLAALLQSKCIFIIHIFKKHPMIVNKILHLNLKFNRYSILMRFAMTITSTIAGLETNLLSSFLFCGSRARATFCWAGVIQKFLKQILDNNKIKYYSYHLSSLKQFVGWFWCSGVITNDTAIELIEKGYNVSCQCCIMLWVCL